MSFEPLTIATALAMFALSVSSMCIWCSRCFVFVTRIFQNGTIYLNKIREIQNNWKKIKLMFMQFIVEWMLCLVVWKIKSNSRSKINQELNSFFTTFPNEWTSKIWRWSFASLRIIFISELQMKEFDVLFTWSFY